MFINLKEIKYNMNILLLSPPFRKDYMRNARCDYFSISGVQWLPIWLSYCGALLESNGHKVSFIDAQSEGLTHEETLKKIKNVDLAVIYSSIKSQENDIDFAEKIKEKTDCNVVFVGPFASINPRKMFVNSKVNLVVRGEFEYPVLELANDVPYDKIKNLYYKKDEKIKENPMRPLLNREQLDKLPFVTAFYKQHVNIRNYHVPQQIYPFIDLFTGRGCAWGRCSFCLWVHSFIPGPAYNTRSIENVIEEIEFVKKNINFVKEIFIQDDMLPKWRARELSNAIIESDLDVIWSCYLKGDMDYETLALMKKSGCRLVHVGYEAASNTILKNICKGITAKVMTEFTKNAKKARIKIHGDFLLGLPDETVKSIRQTIEWAKKLDVDTAQFSLINLYEGTPLYEYLKDNNYLKDDEPSYPHLSNEEMREWAKTAVREFYFSWRYAKKVIKEPQENLLPRLKAVRAVLPYILWKH